MIAEALVGNGILIFYLIRWGHYLVAFWFNYYNSVGNLQSQITYVAERNETRWSGKATIPLSYLPPKVISYHQIHFISFQSPNAQHHYFLAGVSFQRLLRSWKRH